MTCSEDIRDVESGETYYVVTADAKGGRCVMNGLFIAVWRDKDGARQAAIDLGEGHHAVKQRKPQVGRQKEEGIA